MAKKKLDEIKLITHFGSDNEAKSYELKYNGQEYLYFNRIDLLAGFMAHIGLQEADCMGKGTILTMLFQAMLGKEWEENVNAMRNRISEMESSVRSTIVHLEQVARDGDRLEPRINELGEEIKTLQESIKQQKEENRKALMDTRETSQTAKATAAEFKKEAKKLKEIVEKTKKGGETVNELKALADKHLKNIEACEQKLFEIYKEKPNEKGKTAKSGKTTKKGGRNKAADAVVAKAAEEQLLEEKLKEYWDKKDLA